MSAISSSTVVNLFKKVYGDMTDLLPEDYLVAKLIPFTTKQKTGEKYVEAVALTAETGFTLAGSAMDVVELNPAIAGAVQQIEVQPYISVLGSVIPWGVIARSAGGGEVAFYDATKNLVKNNLKSHGKLREITRIYGQSAALLGYVSYATATYRGAAFVNGGGTLNDSVFGNITFTAGINVANKLILLAPGQFASGIWVGMEGVIVQQVDATNAVVAEGKLVNVDSELGIIQVDFVPVAASSTTSHRLCFKGMAAGKEEKGIQSILAGTGSLFGIPVTQYSLWKANRISLANVKLTLERLQNGIAAAVNRGGLEGDIDLLVNPRTWATMVTTESGARSYDDSYKSSEAVNGFEKIQFYHQAGKITVHAHRMVKEGDAFGLHVPDWIRSGSCEVSFSIPGVNKEIIFPLENSTGYAYRSFTDQYIFNHAPAKSIYWSGINDESAT